MTEQNYLDPGQSQVALALSPTELRRELEASAVLIRSLESRIRDLERQVLLLQAQVR